MHAQRIALCVYRRASSKTRVRADRPAVRVRAVNLARLRYADALLRVRRGDALRGCGERRSVGQPQNAVARRSPRRTTRRPCRQCVRYRRRRARRFIISADGDLVTRAVGRYAVGQAFRDGDALSFACQESRMRGNSPSIRVHAVHLASGIRCDLSL